MGFSKKAIERLTLYHCILTHTVAERDFVSSAEIASLLKFDDSQVRKDIAACHIIGKQKYGYPVSELKTAIEKTLGFTKKKTVFIIGAGNLGSALIKYTDFNDYGIEICALFDNDPQKIGKEINGKMVYPMSKLTELTAQYHVKTAILTVPAQQAQNVTDVLVKSNICFIWNFTPCVLKVPENVVVHYENIISGFLQMQHEF